MPTPPFSDSPVGSTTEPCPPAKNSVTYWIEIELVGEDDEAIAYERYLVVLPNGEKAAGYLDEDGFARLEGIPVSGSCAVQFPDLDREAWDKLQTLAAQE